MIRVSNQRVKNELTNGNVRDLSINLDRRVWGGMDWTCGRNVKAKEN